MTQYRIPIEISAKETFPCALRHAELQKFLYIQKGNQFCERWDQ